jgi:hypothetical protein
MSKYKQPKGPRGYIPIPEDEYRERLHERLLASSERVGDCLLWTGKLTYSGYGHISVRDQKDNVHRVAYKLWVGPIPEGMEIDHLCNVRNCFEPAHLEPVTHAENLRRIRRRQTHCNQGHLRAEDSYIAANGRLTCRSCKRGWVARARARKTEGAVA